MKITQVSAQQFPVLIRAVAGIVFAALLVGCSNGSNNGFDFLEQDTPPFQELIDQGVTRYLGVYSPSSTTEEGNIVNHQFAGSDGPLCLSGKPYTMATRDEGTEDLMIFLQGGGACWFDLCAATEEAGPGIPPFGILNPDPASNNPLAGISTVYFPYCDGGLFASDADVDSDDDGAADRFHRGLHNLSAGLDVAVRSFPAPRRIVLVGVSGGGFGTLFALPLVRYLYPGVPIDVINDSGLGITRPDEPQWIQQIADYWNINSFFPASCPECKPVGSSAAIINWQLQEDPDVRLGMLSYTQDSTIGTFFLGLSGPAFEAVLRPTVADVEAVNPERMRSFLRAGGAHTFLLDLSTSVEGVTVADWVSAMLEGPADDWNSVAE